MFHAYRGVLTLTMSGSGLIKAARKRAGLTQRELAELLGTTQPVVARWEAGRASPSFERVVDAIRIVSRDDEHTLWVHQNLRLTPRERLAQLQTGKSAIDKLAAKAVRREEHDVRP